MRFSNGLSCWQWRLQGAPRWRKKLSNYSWKYCKNNSFILELVMVDFCFFVFKDFFVGLDFSWVAKWNLQALSLCDSHRFSRLSQGSPRRTVTPSFHLTLLILSHITSWLEHYAHIFNKHIFVVPYGLAAMSFLSKVRYFWNDVLTRKLWVRDVSRIRWFR